MSSAIERIATRYQEPWPFYLVDIYILPERYYRRSWHGPPPLFFNFLFTNLFSIKFIYFFIISSLFPYFNLFVSIFIQSYVNIKLHVSTLYRWIDTNNYLYRVDTCNLMLT